MGEPSQLSDDPDVSGRTRTRVHGCPDEHTYLWNNTGDMDLKTLKLELLERIALIDNEERLLALKRVLDAPRGYGIPNEQMSVVKEGEDRYGSVTVDELVEIIRRDLGK